MKIGIELGGPYNYVSSKNSSHQDLNIEGPNIFLIY